VHRNSLRQRCDDPLNPVCTLASAFGRPVFPHGHSIHPALHVITSQSPAECPMAEFLIRPQAAKQALHTRQLWPENGSIAPPEQPGLGIELDPDRIDTRRSISI
jgi:L-rhamnonate dehydratase